MGNEDVVEVTSNLRLLRRSEGVSYELGPRGTTGAVGDQNETYTAELWKTSDGGKTWKNLIADKGNFYFNDIHCIDDTHCVAVGEGFSNDGSASPGARVYLTSDGETFHEVHREATTCQCHWTDDYCVRLCLKPAWIRHNSERIANLISSSVWCSSNEYPNGLVGPVDSSV